MKQPARDMLKKLGSGHSQRIGWLDMWAMVVVKGSSSKSPLAEDMSKSPDFGSWGQPVRVTAEVPLSPLSEASCDNWPDTDEGR